VTNRALLAEEKTRNGSKVTTTASKVGQSAHQEAFIQNHREQITSKQGSTHLVDNLKDKLPIFMLGKPLTCQRVCSQLGTRTKHERRLQKKVLSRCYCE